MNQSHTVRAELLRLDRMPRWGRAQTDDWDAHSRFIYDVHSLDDLRHETRRVAVQASLPLADFGCYVVNRWYNYHTHQAVLDMLCAHPRVRREPCPRHLTIDLYLDDVPFDLKLARFPRAFPGDLEHARAHPQELVDWLYQNQSTQSRYHTANRLFVVLHHAQDPERTWEVRRMYDLLERTVADFLAAPQLFRADVEDGNGRRCHPQAGLIFCIYCCA